MRVHALLAWYDETPADLTRAVLSCEGIADHVVALDGRYQLYAPERSPSSSPDQAEAIRAACALIGVACTIHTPTTPWASEGHKRTAMFQIATTLGTINDDWVIPIDADEEFVGDPVALRAALRNTQQLVLGLYYKTPKPEVVTDEMHAGTDMRSLWQGRVLRLVPGLRVKPSTHWHFLCDAGSLRQYEANVTAIHVLHHTAARATDRVSEKAEYIYRRNGAGES